MNFYRNLTAFPTESIVPQMTMVELGLYLAGVAVAGLIVLAVLFLLFQWFIGFPRWGRGGHAGGRIGKVLPKNDRDA